MLELCSCCDLRLTDCKRKLHGFLSRRDSLCMLFPECLMQMLGCLIIILTVVVLDCILIYDL